MMVTRSLVSVVDDDESVRESLPHLLREFGYAACAFSSAEEFLVSDCVRQTRCLIVDVVMPGMTGLDLQRELAHRGQEIPIVFITAVEDEASVHECSDRAMPWSACSSHSAIRPCSGHSMPFF
jgi:FixJ family two-component response regulator